MLSISVITPLLSLHSLLTPDPGIGPECLSVRGMHAGASWKRMRA